MNDQKENPAGETTPDSNSDAAKVDDDLDAEAISGAPSSTGDNVTDAAPAESAAVDDETSNQIDDEATSVPAAPPEPAEETHPRDGGGVTISSPDPLPPNEPARGESDNDASNETTPDQVQLDAPDDEAEFMESFDNTEAPTVRLPRPLPQSEHKTTQVEIGPGEATGLRQIKISCHRCGQKLDVTFLEPFSMVDCPSCEAEIIIPKWFDNYLLEEPGGVGGMATVYRALDLGLDREVAIKVLNSDFATSKDKGELFLHEARTAATINHYAVIPVYTCGEFEEKPYIVMQFMEGGSLEFKLKTSREKLDIPSVSKWIRDVADGLDNAKRHGIIHHDVKPGNIMLDSEGNPKIGDFGIAQAVNDTRTEKIQEFTKTWISPHYVSPEKVATGKEEFIGDIYSLGATYYHLATGHTPFEDDDVNQLIRMRLFKDPIEPEKLRLEIPAAISKLIVKMMDRDPDKRPKYREVIKEINSYLNKVPKSKMPSKKKSGKTITKLNMTLKSSIEKPRVGHLSQVSSTRRNPFSRWIHRAVVVAILAGAVTYLHKSGKGLRLFNYVTGSTASPLATPADLHPSVTEALSSGNFDAARQTARRAVRAVGSDLDAKAQAATQLAFAEYLANSPAAASRCADVAERLVDASLDKGDPRLAIIYFLAEKNIPPEALLERFESEPPMALLGRLAIFLRRFYHGATRRELAKAFDEYNSAAKVSDAEFWGNAWRNRLSAWSDVVHAGRGKPDDLEPLLVKGIRQQTRPSISEPSDERRFDDSSRRIEGEDEADEELIPPSGETGDSDSSGDFIETPPIDDISVREFIASRKPFADRPAGDSLEYDLISVQDYFDKLTNPAYKAAETRRFDSIKDSKEYFIRMFRMSEYVGQVNIKGKRPFKGSIALANENVVLVRTVDRRGKRKIDRYEWDQVDFQQYINFYKYFASERKKIVGPNMTKDDLKRLAAEDYFRLAILCDWHGRYKEALKYAKETIETWPGKRREVNQVLLGP